MHDYSGVTRALLGTSLANLEAFDRQLGTDTDGRAKDLWITEAGMLLNSRTKLGSCPSTAPIRPAPWVRASTAMPPPSRRISPRSSPLPQAGVSVPITHLFWYEWEGKADWDSGLLDATGVAALRVVRVLRFGDLHRQPERGLTGPGR